LFYFILLFLYALFLVDCRYCWVGENGCVLGMEFCILLHILSGIMLNRGNETINPSVTCHRLECKFFKTPFKSVHAKVTHRCHCRSKISKFIYGQYYVTYVTLFSLLNKLFCSVLFNEFRHRTKLIEILFSSFAF
jgi:hypothetical protein